MNLDTSPKRTFVNRKIKNMTLFTFKEIDQYMDLFVIYSNHGFLFYDGFINILTRFDSPLRCGNSMTQFLFELFSSTYPDRMNQLEYILGLSILKNKCKILFIDTILYDLIYSVEEFCDKPFTGTDMTPKQLATYLKNGPKSIFGFTIRLISIRDTINQIFIIKEITDS